MTSVQWLNGCERIGASKVAVELPQRPGIYAIFVDNPASIPQPFRSALEKRSNPNLLYIGQASVSLHKRVWEQEFLHKSPGTFFRSVGVMLGYVSPSGGRNFKFAEPDKDSISRWVVENLSVGWTIVNDQHKIDASEEALIQQFCPLLNIKGNPLKLEFLSELRARSIRGTK